MGPIQSHRQWSFTTPPAYCLCALIEPNFESSLERNEECYVNSPKDVPCGQGRIPLYAVVAETVEEVQATVRFARERDLRLIVRNTGHGSVRSCGPDSLQINLSKFKSINHTQHFIPQGGSQSMGQAVTLGAAILGHDASETGAKEGFFILPGICSTVGIAGGYLQGGGLSYLSPIYGMPADNALEFVVVTAKGEIVVANDFQNQDLFWALRGGGGGTFGIAVSSTVRAFSDVPATAVSLNVTIPANESADREKLWSSLRAVLSMYPALDDKQNGVVVMLALMPDQHHTAIVSLIGWAVNATIADVDAQYAPLCAQLDALGIPYTYSTLFQPSLAALLATPLAMDIGGDNIVEGSIFLSKDLFYEADGPARIVDIVARSQVWPGDYVGFELSGGQVRENKDVVDTPIHPTWRDSLALMWLRRNMSSSPSPAEQVEYRRNMTMFQMPLLRSLESRMGSYVNVADMDEPKFQDAFWGDNYERLYRIKKEWDEDGLFIVRAGVGSEDWDEEGLCRVR
ncbi:hypothetical protein BDV59DRAFT_207807 [Aspergillus ambiguus]|uniref:FAD-dependent oxidoreductase n=1 Tax=Aspergillus ambiguus TaxID=176160 RepID=UPI003CCE4B68